MSTHDPISDLITRIRNAQMRAKPKVSTPGSKMRANVLEVLKAEGYIRGYASVEHASGRSELEIELKYFDGEPVIREIERVSKPGRRVYASVKNLPRDEQRARHFGVVDAEGNHGRPRSARRECGRRNSLHGVLRKGLAMSRIGKRPVTVPVGRYRDRRGTDREDEGAEGPASVRRP